MDYIKIIAENIKLDCATEEEIYSLITPTKDSSLGDYALPCFRFAKAMRLAPNLIAENLAVKLKVSLPKNINNVEAVAGYLNFTVDKVYFAEDVIERIISLKERYGDNDIGLGKIVCIDYSSVNIAKPFHIGHLSTTVIGAALYRMYKSLGYKVIGINHLGDWGTQFGKLITAYKRWGVREEVERDNIKALLKLYIRFHEEEEQNPALSEEGRLWFRRIEEGNAEAIELWNWFKDITMREINKIYVRLGIRFDSYAGESFYNDKMEEPLQELIDKGLLVKSEGAEVVELNDYNMPPCLLKKADGATLYATRDIAAAFYRKKTYDFYKCLYVVAYQQNLHFKQWFKVVELMGYDWAKDLIHVAFGMVSLEEGTLSTRKGRVVFLEEVLDRTVARALEIIKEKSPDLLDKEIIAEKIGVGAVIFSALSNGRIKDITFSYDKVLNFDGETGPYVQYTGARCRSVLAKVTDNIAKPDYSTVITDEGNELIKLLEKYPKTVMDAAEKYEPSIITRHIIDVAEGFNKYYFSSRIIGDDKDGERARLNLTEATRVVIDNGLALLGIESVERM